MPVNNLTNGMPWNVTVTVAPAVEPVTLEEMKIHLRQDFRDDDALISGLITAARRHVEMFTRRALVNTTFTLKLDKFPTEIRVPRSPLSSVTSITHVDNDGVPQTVAASVYSVDTDTEPARISLAHNESWPETRSQNNAVVVTFVSGFGAAATNVPDDYKTAMKLLTGHWYQSREAVAISIGGNIVEIPLGVMMILGGVRVKGAA